jgi:hypothetical protein
LIEGTCRVGRCAAIASYLGSGPRFGHTRGEFSVEYARQNESDYETFVIEIREGRPEAMEIE